MNWINWEKKQESADTTDPILGFNQFILGWSQVLQRYQNWKGLKADFHYFFFFFCGTWASHYCGLSHCGAQAPGAQPLRGMWDLPGAGHEPMSPASAGGLSTTAPPGKPLCPLISNSPFTLPPRPWKTPFKLFDSINLTHISEIMPYLSFCDWLISSSITGLFCLV